MPITKATASSIAPAAKGDLVVGSATNDASVLAVGTNNQVLTVDSSTTTGLKWATAASGGMTELATGTLTGASIVISNISGAYKDLQLVLRDIYGASDASARIRLNGNTTSKYDGIFLERASASLSNGEFIGDTSWTISGTIRNTDYYNAGVLTIYDYANTAAWKVAQGDVWSLNASDARTARSGTYWFEIDAAITSLTIFMSTGNLSGGTYILYGVS